MSSQYITHISPFTHMCEDLDWFKGNGFYVCTPALSSDGTGLQQRWDGPFVDVQAARLEYGNIRCHTPALGSRSGG